MLWLKALHLIFLISWFAGLFYLPRLFVYHAMSDDQISHDRFLIMERKLLNGIMLPAAILTLFSGLWMLFDYAWTAYESTWWLSIKLILVSTLFVYHYQCRRFYLKFLDNNNQQSHVFFRWFNEYPVLVLIAVIILITIKPF
ncbi:MAG: CopD family protein [Gammaproteobacteria bacterium]|nr:CopD family protein [Gammaproteobacteria bacterium]